MRKLLLLSFVLALCCSVFAQQNDVYTKKLRVRDSIRLGGVWRSTWPSGGGSGWGLTGNAGTNATTNYLGTSDSVDLVIKRNGIEALRVKAGGSLLATGNLSSGITPASGAGTRLMWIPAKGAFRAGKVDGTAWDNSNIGLNSIAVGYDARASGDYSAAFNVGTVASGNYSTAFGGSTASGQYSFACISSSTASASGSFAASVNGTATGDYSAAFGVSNQSKSYGGFVVGIYNDITAAASATVPNNSNRLFQVGNGTSSVARSNALTILGSGNAGFGVLVPTAKIHIAAGSTVTGTAPIQFTSGEPTATPADGQLHYKTGLLILDSSPSQRDTIARLRDLRSITSTTYGGTGANNAVNSPGSFLRSNSSNGSFTASTLLLPNSATTNYIPYATSSNTWGESSNLQYNGSQFTATGIGYFTDGVQIPTNCIDMTAQSGQFTISSSGQYLFKSNSSPNTIEFPDPSNFTGRHIIIKNASGDVITYVGSHIPRNIAGTTDAICPNNFLKIYIAQYDCIADAYYWHLSGRFDGTVD